MILILGQNSDNLTTNKASQFSNVIPNFRTNMSNPNNIKHCHFQLNTTLSENKQNTISLIQGKPLNWRTGRTVVFSKQKKELCRHPAYRIYTSYVTIIPSTSIVVHWSVKLLSFIAEILKSNISQLWTIRPSTNYPTTWTTKFEPELDFRVNS